MTKLQSIANPFRDNVVQDAWQEPLDIPEIHAEAFEACKAGIESAARAIPDSLLVYGEAGSGKTHLLSRLQRHLSDTARAAPDRTLHCVFSSARLQTNPLMLWQHVRRRMASDLMRREQGLTQLQRLVAHQLGLVDGRSPRAAILELRVLQGEDQQALSQHLRTLAAKLDLPRNLCVVIEHLILNRNVRDASAWLAGDSLPDAALAELGVGVDPEEDREESARQVVTALCRLAGETLPIVFCFDQVESLQRSAQDDEALFRFGRMAADLHDADANVFIITCLQVAFLDQFKRAVRAADLDRIARRTVLLNHLTPSEIESLVLSRLRRSPELEALRAEHPGERFYPLKASFVAELAVEPHPVPRKILALAARAFDEVQHGRGAPPPTTAQYLGAELLERQRSSSVELTASDTRRVLLQGAPLLAEITGAPVETSDGADGVDLVFGGARPTAVSLRSEADGRSLTPKLKALVANTPRQDGSKLVIVRDARLPITKTAVKAREYLKTLQERGVSLLEPSVEALAALDALSSILADAKSGDLANEAQTLEASAVLSWLRSLRTGVELEPVKEFVDAVLESESRVVDAVEQDFLALLAHEHVLSAEIAAQILNVGPEKVIELGRKASTHCLVLEGPPTVLLDVAGVASDVERTSAVSAEVVS